MGRLSGGRDGRGGLLAEPRLGSSKTQGEFRAQQVAQRDGKQNWQAGVQGFQKGVGTVGIIKLSFP